MERHPGAEASLVVRSAKSLAHLESMRDAYVEIVRMRLADLRIDASKKLSHYHIARALTEAGYRAPRGGNITYKIALRLYEVVGDVELPLEPRRVKKAVDELRVGDFVVVISPRANAQGWTGVIRKILPESSAFQVQFPPARQGRERIYLAEQIEHQPDELYFYDPKAAAEREHEAALRLRASTK